MHIGACWEGLFVAFVLCFEIMELKLLWRDKAVWTESLQLSLMPSLVEAL